MTSTTEQTEPAVTAGVEERLTRSVLVSHITRNTTEEQVKDILSEVGIVIGCVLSTAGEKSDKFALCEYSDDKTALSAVRNLNGCDIEGKDVVVEIATSESARDAISLHRLLEEEDDEEEDEDSAGMGASASSSNPEAISKAVASLPADKMFELMKQMKSLITRNPTEARKLLLQNTQLAYALLQAQVVMRVVDPRVAEAILNRKPSEVPPSDIDYDELPEQSREDSEEIGYDVNMQTNEFVENLPPTIEDQQFSMSQPTRQPQSFGVQDQIPGFSTSTIIQHSQPPTMLPSHGPPAMVQPVQGAAVMAGARMQQPSGPPRMVQGAPQAVLRSAGYLGAQARPLPGGPHAAPVMVGPPPGKAFTRPPQIFDAKDSMKFDVFNKDPRTGMAVPGLDGPPPSTWTAPLSGTMLQQHAAASGLLSGAGTGQEKAALIMQVLQLPDEQIARLPPDQQESVRLLKMQLSSK